MPKLHVLGCSDAFNSGGRRHTSFLLEIKDSQILIDCGATTSLAFKQSGHSFQNVDAIIITHFHGDHYGGLPYLLLEAALVQKREKPLLIVSPPGLKDRLYQLMSLLYKGSEGALEAFPIHYREYEEGRLQEFSFGRLTALQVAHTPESLPHGIRLELEDKIFAFSGDTGWHENLIKLADGADLFICECNFFKTEKPAHLNYQTLIDKKPRLKAKMTFLTHLGEEMLKRKGELEVEILEDGQNINF